MEKSYITALGVVAGTLTTLAYLPQVIKSWKSKSTKDLSFGMFGLLFVGIIMWTIYGVLLGSMPLIIFNSITLAEAAAILYVKMRYK
jgi:MtN3 and saliva related transmembrane protein